MAYNNKSIKVLEGLQAVRERPGMYIGNTNTEGLHHLLWEVVDNAIDEHLAGHADEIKVTLHKDGSASVSDNGRGIPVDMHEKGIPTLRLILTTLHAGGKFDSDSYKTSGGLHGVGSSVVNALSSDMKATVFKDGYKYTDTYAHGGTPQTRLSNGQLPKEASPDVPDGTIIQFTPDDTIFETTKWDRETIKHRMHEKAFLNRGLTLHLVDERSEEVKTNTFIEEDGLLSFIKTQQKEQKALTEPFVIKGVSNDIEIELALMHVRSAQESILSYVNGVPTPQGGTHVAGLRSGFTRLINGYIKDLSLYKDTFKGKEIRSGLLAVLSIKHTDPQFEGQTKGKLGSTDARFAVEDVVLTAGREAYNVRMNDVQAIVQHAKRMITLHKKEEALHKSLETKESRLQVNGKLANCSSRNPRERELYIVEGDSAGGTTKQGRDRRTQAVLPLRGKVLNVEKTTLKSALKNKEISSLYSALGAGVGDTFDPSKLKFDKIVLLTDADVDGSHIRVLLLTLFWRLSPDLILDGHVYRGVPPLYKVTTSSTEQYVYSDKELKQLQSDGRIKIKSIQRYKGLGEMDAEQLWETTMNPDTRVLEQITIDDIDEANGITEQLMGTKTQPRREFITTFGQSFDN